jgi:hypothetical protein
VAGQFYRGAGVSRSIEPQRLASPQRIAVVNDAIAKFEASRSNRQERQQLRTVGESIEKEAASAKTPSDAERLRAVAAIIKKNAV